MCVSIREDEHMGNIYEAHWYGKWQCAVLFACLLRVNNDKQRAKNERNKQPPNTLNSRCFINNLS